MTYFRSTRGTEFSSQLPLRSGRMRGLEDAPESARALDILRAVWCRKWHILACAFFIGLAFFSYAARLPALYSTETTLLLDPRSRQIVARQDQVVADLELTNATLESEVAQLQSPELMRAVIRDLGAERFQALDPQNHRPGSLTRGLNWLKTTLSRDQWPSVRVLVSVEERYLNRVATSILSGLQVQRVGNSHVIRLRLTTSDPNLSAQVANALAETHIARQLETRKQVTRSATRWLSDQVAARQTELAAAELKIGAFQQQQLSLDGASRDVLEQRLGELNRQLALSRAEKTTAQARAAQIDRDLAAKGAVAVAAALLSDVLTQLRARKDALQSEDTALANDYGPAHATRLRLAEELGHVEALIAQEVQNILQMHRNEIAVLEVREGKLAADVLQLEGQLATVSQTSVHLRQLQTEAQIARESYEGLVARLGEARAQIDIQHAEARVIAPAQIPMGPSAPRPKLLGFFGACIGFSLGLLAVLGFEAMGRGFSSASEVERLTGLPVLAVLPLGMTSTQRQNRRFGLWRILSQSVKIQQMFQRQIGQLKSILALRSPGQPKVHLLLSATDDGSGQSVTLALARHYFNTGDRTLFVSIGSPSPESRQTGIQSAQQQGFKWIKLPSPEKSEMDLINCLNDELPGNDTVVMYAPATQILPACLRALPDGTQTLLLVRWRKTPRTRVGHVLALLENLGLSPLGVVLTEVDVRFASEDLL